jgi:hypothetical protein
LALSDPDPQVAPVIRGRSGNRKRVRFGAPDASLTDSTGVLAVAELVEPKAFAPLRHL